MWSTRPARLIPAIFAALAMTVFVSARAAFSQDADSGTSVDANWESTGPAIDEDAAAADKVLEIPQAKCAKDGTSGPCDATSDDGNSDDTQAINAPSTGAPPPTLDDDTASNTVPDPDWGTVDEYQNEQVYAVPYAVYPYSVAAVGTINRPAQFPASAYAPMSSPLTQPARPSLNPGPWMNSPSMSAFSRPAGSPMMGSMMMRGPSFGFHR